MNTTQHSNPINSADTKAAQPAEVGLLDLDDDTPLTVCPMRKPGDDTVCESCQ